MNQMNWRQYFKRTIPSILLNRMLLKFPWLYKTDLVYYETNFSKMEIGELLKQLRLSMDCEGDIIECGSSRCGASIIMADFLRRNQKEKTIYALDSFEGFNSTELGQEKKMGLTNVSNVAFTSTSYDYVKRKIKILGFEDVVIPRQGLFQVTLPHIDFKVCFSLIDCCLKDSLLFCAEKIWPHLVSGGRLVFDDFNSNEFQGARIGIETFVNKYGDNFVEHGSSGNLYFVCKK